MENGAPQHLLRKPACPCHLYVFNPYSLHSIRGPFQASFAVVNNSALSVTWQCIDVGVRIKLKWQSQISISALKSKDIWNSIKITLGPNTRPPLSFSPWWKEIWLWVVGTRCSIQVMCQNWTLEAYIILLMDVTPVNLIKKIILGTVLPVCSVGPFRTTCGICSFPPLLLRTVTGPGEGHSHPCHFPRGPCFSLPMFPSIQCDRNHAN